MHIELKSALSDYKERTGKKITLKELAMHIYKKRKISINAKAERLSHLSNERSAYIATLEEVMAICIRLEIDYNTFIQQFVKTKNKQHGKDFGKVMRCKKAD